MTNDKKYYKPTEVELNGAPKAFLYEFQMFRSSVQNCMQNHSKVALETALLHVRNLFDFFVGGHPTKGSWNEDNICAGYFIDDRYKNKEGWWESSKLLYTLSRKDDINKSLSHLTFSRIKENYKWDDLPKIKEEIETAYTEFIQLLPKEEMGKWEV
jgi:hypothetical protein